MADPQDIPRNPDDSFVPLTWAEGGTATEPSAGRKGTGWQPGDVVTEAENNWLSRDPMRALRAFESRVPLASEGLFGSWLARNGSWSDNGVAALEGFLSDTVGGVSTFVADVWVDPSGDGAVRVQVSVPKGSPHTFTANRDTYVFVPASSIAPPTITDGELTYLEVAIGAPQPPTPAGTVPVWRVETDGASIADQELLVQTFPILNTVGIDTLGVNTLQVAVELDLAGDAMLKGDTEIGDDPSDTCTVVAALDAQNDVTLGSSSTDSIQFPGTPSFQTPVNLDTGGSPAAGQLTAELDGSIIHLLWNDFAAGESRVHYSAGGYRHTSETVTTATPAAASTVALATTNRLDAPTNLLVTVSGYALRAVAGNASFQVEQDDGALTWSNLGAGRSLPIDSVNWTWFSLTREVIGPDAVTRLFRLNLNGNAQNIQIRDSVIEVRAKD